VQTCKIFIYPIFKCILLNFTYVSQNIYLHKSADIRIFRWHKTMYEQLWNPHIALIFMNSNSLKKPIKPFPSDEIMSLHFHTNLQANRTNSSYTKNKYLLPRVYWTLLPHFSHFMSLYMKRKKLQLTSIVNIMIWLVVHHENIKIAGIKKCFNT
jgi:hypothetical protein